MRTIRKLGIVALILACSGCTWARYMLELRREQRQPPRVHEEWTRQRESPCLCIWPDDECSDELPSVCRMFGGCVDSCRATCPEVEDTDGVTFEACKIKEGVGAT